MFTVGFKKISAFAQGIVAAEARAAGKAKKLFGGAKQFKGVTDAGKTNAYSRAAAIPDKVGPSPSPRSIGNAPANRAIKKLDTQAAAKEAPKKPDAPAAPAAEKKPEGFGGHFDKAKDWVKKNPLKSTAIAGAAGVAAGRLSKDDNDGRQQ